MMPLIIVPFLMVARLEQSMGDKACATLCLEVCDITLSYFGAGSATRARTCLSTSLEELPLSASNREDWSSGRTPVSVNS